MRILVLCLLLILFSCGDSLQQNQTTLLYEIAEYNSQGGLKSLSNFGESKRIDLKQGFQVLTLYDFNQVMFFLNPQESNSISFNLHGIDFPIFGSSSIENTTLAFVNKSFELKHHLGEGFVILYALSEAEKSDIDVVLNSDSIQKKMPRDLQFMWSYNKNRSIEIEEGQMKDSVFSLYAVRLERDELKCINGFDVLKVEQAPNKNTGKPEPFLVFTEAGGEKFMNLSMEKVQQCIVFVLHQKVYADPTISQPIFGGSVHIPWDSGTPECQKFIKEVNAFRRNGECRFYYLNGNLREKKHFINGKALSHYTIYDENGKLIKEFK